MDPKYIIELLEEAKKGKVDQVAFATMWGAEKVAYALRCLGNGDAATSMGAIEALGKVLKEELSSISSSISEVATEMTKENGG